MKTTAEQLREYKELLDSDVITEDEFNHLKSELLSQVSKDNNKSGVLEANKNKGDHKSPKKVYAIIGAVIVIIAIIVVAIVLKKTSNNSQLPLGVNWGDDLKTVQKKVEENAKFYKTDEYGVHADGVDTLGYNSRIDFYVREDKPLDQIIVFIWAADNDDKGNVEANDIIDHYKQLYGEETEIKDDEDNNTYTHKWKTENEEVSVIVMLDDNCVGIGYDYAEKND